MSTTAAEFDLGEGMFVRIVDIQGLREQDINAQVMQPADMTRLTENIKQRGQLESLPYCYQPAPDAPIEIVSGHHRVRAARAAGMSQIPIIVDTVAVPTSTKVARQIAHNQLHGEHDGEILKLLVGMIGDVDDLLLTGLGEDWLPTPEPSSTNLSVPHVDLDLHTLTLSFLPSQMDDFRDAVMMIERGSHVGVAKAEQYEPFAKACHEFMRFASILSMTTTISVLTDVARREVAEMEEAGVPARAHWQRTATLIGPALPPDTAKQLRKVLDLLTEHGEVSTPAEAIAILCDQFLTSRTEPASK